LANPSQSKVYPSRDYYENELKSLEYYDYSVQKTREGFLGNYVKELYVYVLNKDSVGKYFTVVFEIKNDLGKRYNAIVTKYIGPGETEKFAYQHVQVEGDKIIGWTYKVIPRNN